MLLADLLSEILMLSKIPYAAQDHLPSGNGDAHSGLSPVSINNQGGPPEMNLINVITQLKVLFFFK